MRSIVLAAFLLAVGTAGASAACPGMASHKAVYAQGAEQAPQSAPSSQPQG